MIFTVPSRRMPVVRVYGARYLVDLGRRQLRRLDKPRRVIRFEREDAANE